MDYVWQKWPPSTARFLNNDMDVELCHDEFDGIRYGAYSMRVPGWMMLVLDYLSTSCIMHHPLEQHTTIVTAKAVYLQRNRHKILFLLHSSRYRHIQLRDQRSSPRARLHHNSILHIVGQHQGPYQACDTINVRPGPHVDLRFRLLPPDVVWLPVIDCCGFALALACWCHGCIVVCVMYCGIRRK